MDIYVRQLLLGPMDNFVYLFGAPGGRECAVVDAAWEVGAILDAARADGRTLTAAFVTHGHDDHVNGLPELVKRLGLPVYAQATEIAAFEDLRSLGSALVPLRPDAEVALAGVTVRALATPGHTPGSQCLLCGGALFTGDTLFVGACGRCDLPGSDVDAMFDSLMRLRALPGETVVHSGHDYGDTPTATMGDEARTNPYLVRTRREDFVAYRMRPRA